jgi:hypothetical protein
MPTLEALMNSIKTRGRPLSSYHKGDTIHVADKMTKGYSYTLAEEPGTGFQADFKPWANPGEMLALGVFEGKYLNDCIEEFPAEWFLRAGALEKLSPERADVSLNLFQIHSRLPLPQWQKNGWVPHRGSHSDRYAILSDAKKNPDIRGWFQWYCRYWMGRRLPELDAVQIKRWRAFSRHAGAVKKNCSAGSLQCRPRQRQALLQWSWNPFV